MNNWTTTKHSINRIIVFILMFATVFFFSSRTVFAQTYENTANTSCLYKNYLSAEERLVYDQVYKAILDYNEDLFSLVTPLSEDSLETTMNALFNDSPELFWANTAYQYAVDSQNVAHKIKLKYGIGKADLAAAKANYEFAINNIVAGASKYGTTLEKERFIHDSICAMNTYSTANALNQSAYSALTTGSSVCAGYARAFQIVCNQSGIPCYYVTGTSRGQTHAWNIVCVDGCYFNVDLTWDDCITEVTGINNYTYFNRNDLVFGKDHSRSPQSALIASCN